MALVRDLLREAASNWVAHEASRLAAALAYYTLFSLAPVFVIVTAIAGFFLGEEAVRGELDAQVRGLVGSSGADVISEMVENAAPSPSNLLGILLGALTILIGATTVFAELRASLNLIWEAPPEAGSGVLSLVRARILSIAMILAIGFILLASLVLNAALVATWTYVRHVLPLHPALLEVTELTVSFAIVSVLFATMFKLLPDVALRWNDVWVGGVFTAALFTIGKEAIGLYLGQSSVASMYGASGSIVVLLLWVYYSATIFFFGAEIAASWARRFGTLRSARPAVRPAEPASQAAGRA